MKDFYEIKPDKKFLEKTKFIYLQSFKQNFPAAPESRSAFRHFSIGLASGIALMLIISGSAVYADQTNVGADNPLYPMKRAYESVNLKLSAETQKPLLQMEFANRRLHELEDLAQKNSNGEKAIKLLEDMKISVEDSVNSFETAVPASSTPAVTQIINAPVVFPTETITITTTTESKPEKETEREIKKDVERKIAVCESFNEFFDHDSAYLGRLLRENPDILDKFKGNCQPEISNEKIRQIEEKQQENIRKSEESDRDRENDKEKSSKKDTDSGDSERKRD